MTDIFAAVRRTRILIPDNTPLSLLAMIGTEALDWLFVPGGEVWVTDMVKEEAIRRPDEDEDQRELHRADLAAWFAANVDRIHVQPTDEGQEYRKAMEAWRRVPSSPAELKPSWKGRGEKSILQALDGVESLIANGEAVLAIVDDKKARAAIGILENVDIDLFSTETFIAWLVRRFGVKKAETAWVTIEAAANGKVPYTAEDDPVHIYANR